MAEEARGITAITVSGFKSLREESRIEVRPLTILAGANSSGKSSIMQPLLLMKQTLEAPYDPGPLWLQGPNIKFTSTEEFLSRLGKRGRSHSESFSVQIAASNNKSLVNRFNVPPQKRYIELGEMTYREGDVVSILRHEMSHDEVVQYVPAVFEQLRVEWEKEHGLELRWRITRGRCFLGFELYQEQGASIMQDQLFTRWSGEFGEYLLQLIHVPGFRGNPKRTYPLTPVSGPEFPGTFDNYIAGVLDQKEKELAGGLLHYLSHLKLASRWGTRWVDDTQVELQVGRVLNGDEDDMVSIADVGFGVSQVMPVLVALLAAEPGQLVYLEQPELHLHPRAQVALAQVLADAANRSVRVVAETHSALLLLGVQTLIAEGKLAPNKVMLHWFRRDESGNTKITPQEPDENGAYGDWPEDFDDVQFGADSDYLDAVAARRSKQKHLQNS